MHNHIPSRSFGKILIQPCQIIQPSQVYCVMMAEGACGTNLEWQSGIIWRGHRHTASVLWEYTYFLSFRSITSSESVIRDWHIELRSRFRQFQPIIGQTPDLRTFTDKYLKRMLTADFWFKLKTNFYHRFGYQIPYSLHVLFVVNHYSTSVLNRISFNYAQNPFLELRFYFHSIISRHHNPPLHFKMRSCHLL